MCIRQTYAPASAITRREAGIASQGGDVVDEQRARTSACRATSALAVSIESGTPESCSSTGSTRRSSSSVETASAPGPRRLPADVDQRRPLGTEPPGRRHGRRRVEVVATVREAVGRHVDDAHHRRAWPTLCERGTSHKTMEGRRLRGTRGMSSRRRALIGLAALLLLLIAVGVASTGSVPTGAGGARRPADRIVDVLITLYLLLMVVGVGLWVYIFMVRKDAVANALATRARRRPWVSTVALAIGFSLLALFIRWLSTDEALRRQIAARLHRGSNSASANRCGERLAGSLRAPVRLGPRPARRRARRRCPRRPLPLAPRPAAEARPAVRRAAARPRRRARRDARRSPGRGRPAARGDRRVRPHGAGARRVRLPRSPSEASPRATSTRSAS